DYPDMTEVAKSYLEDINEWEYAVELAVDEALRLESPYWFEVLSEYIERGLTVHYEPNYFKKLISTVLDMDDGRFEDFIEVLWNSYRQSDMYLDWLTMINRIVLS